METDLKNIESINGPGSGLDLKDKFISEFSKSFLAGKDRNKFIDEIMRKESISDSDILKRKLKAFKAYSDNPEFKNFDDSKISIFDLRRAIGKEAMKLENSRSDYIENTFGKFNLSEDEKEILKDKIKKVRPEELDRLDSKEYENLKFLRKILKNPNIKVQQKLNFLDSLSQEEIEKRLETLDDYNRESIRQILYNFSLGKVYDSDLRDLFASSFLKENEKKQILKTFIPYINLKKAVDIGLLDLDNAEKQKEKILEKILKDKYKNLDKDNLEEIIKSASLSDIKIPSEEFFINEDNLDKIATGVGFANVEKDFKNFLKDAEKEAIENGPQNIADLKRQLEAKFSNKLEKLTDFANKSVIRVENVDSDGEKKVSYLRIENIDKNNKTISLRGIGDGLFGKEIINFNSNAQVENLTFPQFLKWISLINSGTFYKEQDLKEKIESGKLNAEISELKQYSKDEFEKNENLKQKAKEQYENQKKKELEELQEELLRVEEELSEEEKKDKKDKNLIENLKIKKSQLETKIKVKQEELDNILKVSDDNLLNILNKQELINKIDSIDEEGKGLGLEKGMFIGIKKDGKKDGGFYEITGIDWNNGMIHLRSNGKKGVQDEQLSLEQFYQAFEKNKAFRLKPISNFEEFLKENITNSKNNQVWEQFEIKNGKIKIKKVPEGYNTSDKNVEYLTKNDSNDLIKIEKVDGDKIEVRFGERKEASSLDDKEAKKHKFKKNKKGKYEGELISLSKETTILTLSELNDIVNRQKKEYVPNWEVGKRGKKDQKAKDLQNPFYNSFSTRFFNGFAIAELIQGAKLMVDGIEEYFKKGNDIHAAKVALSMGKMLPDEVRHSLIIKVEAAEKEAMDKEVEALGKIDSGIATKKIREWLLNKDTPEFKKEAGLMFVLEKYGTLTGKSALYEFKGKFMWYEAFGGRIGDELYNQVKAEAKASDQAFSEEKLMYVLINRQSKGILEPKRRSRLYKDFDGKWKNGIKEEVQKGYNDASNFRTAADMVKGGNDELFTGTLPNAIGWYKKAIERGGSLEDMSEGFFLMLYSGALYFTDQAVYTPYIKSLWDADGMPQIMARMSSNVPDMKLFNKTVLALSKEIETREPVKYSGMYKQAKEIFDKVHSNPPIGTEKERLNNTKEFWSKYGKVLSRTLMSTNGTGDSNIDNDFVKTDKILLEKSRETKDPYAWKLKDTEQLTNQSALKAYYAKMKDYSTESTFKEDFMADAMGFEGIGGMNILQNTLKWFRFNTQGTPQNGKVLSVFFERLAGDIERQTNKENIIFMLSELVAGILKNTGLNQSLLDIFNNSTSDIGSRFNKWGLYIKKDFGNMASKDILSLTPEAKKVLSKVADNIMNGGLGNKDNYYSGGIVEVMEPAKKIVEQIDY